MTALLGDNSLAFKLVFRITLYVPSQFVACTITIVQFEARLDILTDILVKDRRDVLLSAKDFIQAQRFLLFLLLILI